MTTTEASRYSDLPKATRQSELPKRKDPATQTVRVLLADDDPDIRALVAGPLRRRGFQVIEKTDGNQLLDYIAGRLTELNEAKAKNIHTPLVVVTDIRMPGCDGLSIVAGMRRWGWRIPVIVVSALDDDGVTNELDRLSVTAFFRKPFDPQILASFIEGLGAEVPSG